jgi:hypothetical protein
MAGLLSVASTAESLAKVAMVDYGEDSRYNNGSRTLPWGTPVLTGQSSVYSVLPTSYSDKQTSWPLVHKQTNILIANKMFTTAKDM